MLIKGEEEEERGATDKSKQAAKKHCEINDQKKEKK